MGFSVDWLNIVQEFPLDEYPDYFGGKIVSVQGLTGLRVMPCIEDGGEIQDQWALSDVRSIDYCVSKFALHRGSYETNLLIRMENGRLEVRGNPSSYCRLDNYFGVDLDRAVEIYNEVLRNIGLPTFTVGKVEKIWLQGQQKFVSKYTGARITRIDYCQNIQVGMGNVRSFHKWAARQKIYRSSPRNIDIDEYEKWEFSTVYLSTSKYWMNVKLYDKGKNVEDVILPNYEKKLKKSVKDGFITKPEFERLYYEAEDYLNRLACWSAEIGLSRIEYSLRNRWFSQNEGIGHWVPRETEENILSTIRTEFEKLTKRALVYQVDDMDQLTDKEFRILDSWKKGNDVRDTVSRSAFYRFKSSILKKTGHDIAAHPVGLVKQIDSRPVYFQPKILNASDVPDWYRWAS